MGKKVRSLDLYEFDENCVMTKDMEDYKDECFQVSKSAEIINEKYVKEND